MSNPYYTFTPAFVPGEKVRAGRVNNQFTLIEDAFDLLPASSSSLPLGTATLGVESGSGNAYVVTMPNTRTANAAGDEVVFKATHQNSGASTLQVDSIVAVALRRYNGDPLQSGDVLVDAYYVCRYDATNGYFRIVSPALQTNVGTLTYAAPSASVGLVAVAGSATTVMRSDAAPALDQSIVPTWTGVHTFSAASVFSAGLSSGGQVLNASGTALLPAYSFSGDPNTGVYNSSADVISIAAAGAQTFAFSSTQAFASSGAAATPAYSFILDQNTGAYSVGADDWGVATGGTLRFDISTTAITSTLPHLNAAGSATAPSFSFSGDPNTGSYSVGADDWGVATGGTLRFDISTTAFTATLPWRGQDGVVGAPAFSFSGDTDTGIYRSSANVVSIAAAGAQALAVGSTQTFFLDGAAATPGMSFILDQDTGVYRFASDTMILAAGGSGRAVISTQGLAILDGSAASPSLYFNADTDTGIYRSTTNTIGISAGGTAVAIWDSGTLSFLTSAGTVASFSGGVCSIAVAASGTQAGLHVGSTATGYIEIGDNVTAPSAPSTNRARIYVDGADGDLKIRFGDGTIKTIVTDT